MAAELAQAAGRLLLELRDGGLQGQYLKDAGDRCAHDLLISELRARRPSDAIRSEEAAEVVEGTSGRLWIIDPLDGTREYVEPPRSDWAVHVALCSSTGSLLAGAVALPALGLVLDTANPPPAPTAEGRGGPRVLVSRTRPLTQAVELADHLRGELVPMGSAGAKAMAVVRGDADIYAHAGGQYEWDSAAPVAVAAAAGLHVSRLDGRELRYGNPDPWLPDLLICRPELAATVIDFCTRRAD